MNNNKERQFANGIFVKRKETAKGDLISISIRKPEGGYDKYVFYPKKEQEDDRYIEYYGFVDNYKGEQK